MIRLSLFVFTAIALGQSQVIGQDETTEREWLRAPALKAGDTIAFIAPAGPADEEPIRKCAKIFREAGFEVQIPAGLGSRKNGYLSGTDDERAAELNAAIRDKKVRAIFPVRGGYGVMRILDRIDYESLKSDPKIVTGFSDITALHLAIARKCKLISFHSPMPMRDLHEGNAGAFQFPFDSYRRTLFASEYPANATGFSLNTPPGRPAKSLRGGKVTGNLVGGNLSMICATLGTPYEIESRGAILFLEDVNEAPYRIDRCLAQLRLAGVLDQVSGVILGSFTNKSSEDEALIRGLIHEYMSAIKVPVIEGFSVGHQVDNTTLPHGAVVELNADICSIRVINDPVRHSSN